MADIDVDALLAPVNDTAPCGDDLEYDAAFLALEEAARGKPEQQFGDTVIAAQEPDWRAMQSQALALFSRTRDLRVGVHLLRAATRLAGIAGFVPAVRLMHGLLSRHWDHVYPVLDAADNDDATMRLNALAPLADVATVLADVRAAAIGPPRLGLTVRAIEVALGKAEARAGDSVMNEASVVQALADAEAISPGLIDGLLAAHEAVVGIQAVLDAQAGAANGPDLRPLRVLTQCAAQAARQARGDATVPNDTTDAGAGVASAPAPAAAPGAIASRDDAIRTLERVCDWLERSEPSNPAPLLIRRAQRLMTKSFIEIIRDLAPDGLKEVERIAGVDAA
jgi:type VI secretion system protein ImpA